jgi:hypothetical protein
VGPRDAGTQGRRDAETPRKMANKGQSDARRTPAAAGQSGRSRRKRVARAGAAPEQPALANSPAAERALADEPLRSAGESDMAAGAPHSAVEDAAGGERRDEPSPSCAGGEAGHSAAGGPPADAPPSPALDGASADGRNDDSEADSLMQRRVHIEILRAIVRGELAEHTRESMRALLAQHGWQPEAKRQTAAAATASEPPQPHALWANLSSPLCDAMPRRTAQRAVGRGDAVCVARAQSAKSSRQHATSAIAH